MRRVRRITSSRREIIISLINLILLKRNGGIFSILCTMLTLPVLTEYALSLIGKLIEKYTKLRKEQSRESSLY